MIRRSGESPWGLSPDLRGNFIICFILVGTNNTNHYDKKRFKQLDHVF